MRKLSSSDDDIFVQVDTHEIFSETYREFRSLQYSHIESKNKAIDYYRKFTKREVYTIPIDSFATHENVFVEYELSPDEKITFNQSITIILDNLKGNKVKKLLCAVLVSQRLDEILNENNYELVRSFVPDFNPCKLLSQGKGGGGWEEISKELGYSRANSGGGLVDLRNDLKKQVLDIIVKHNLISECLIKGLKGGN